MRGGPALVMGAAAGRPPLSGWGRTATCCCAESPVPWTGEAHTGTALYEERHALGHLDHVRPRRGTPEKGYAGACFFWSILDSSTNNWSCAMSKTIVVAGYGPGISVAVAEKFGSEGFQVAIVGRSAEKLAAGGKAPEGQGVETAAFPPTLGHPAPGPRRIEKTPAS